MLPICASAWSVLALIPLGNVIALWFLAFSDWPAGLANRARGEGREAPRQT
jgi:hypothetical protein